jgi:hypothetical protein
LPVGDGEDDAVALGDADGDALEVPFGLGAR